MKPHTPPTPPDARLLLAPGCAHCPVVLEGLTRLLKAGKLGRLEAINVTAHPEAAREAGTRSVPWYRIGDFEFTGTMPPPELEQWAERAAAGDSQGAYYQYLLENRQAERVVALLRQHPEHLPELVQLLASLETPMAVRIGVGAVLEELAEQGALGPAIDPLVALTRSPLPQVRADACHYLSLSGDPALAPVIRPLLQDPDPEVREIAHDSLATVAGADSSPSPEHH